MVVLNIYGIGCMPISYSFDADAVAVTDACISRVCVIVMFNGCLHPRQTAKVVGESEKDATTECH